MRFLLIAIHVLLAASAIAAGEAATPDQEKDLLGAWKHTEKDELICFDAQRIRVRAEGGLFFFRLKHEGAGKFQFNTQGQWNSATYTLKDKTLSLVLPDRTNTYKKLDEVPPEMELKPLAFGKVAPLEREKVRAIRNELAERLVKDQAVRTDQKRLVEAPKVDEDNTAYLKKIVQECGWVDAERFGQEATNAAFLIVQHSGDLPLMIAALPEIEKDLKAGRLSDGQGFALLYDRTKLYTAEKQRYGSQVSMTNTEVIVLPLEDKNKVDQYRKELGMTPLSQYLDYFKKQGGNKTIKFAD